ncbi:MAG: ribosome recycling factor [Candidatus Eisenbacteria sp.]|nr:ribosome recycling factor [Candidatus Eisenbacteria bacterium]
MSDDETIARANQKMGKAVEVIQREFASVRTGRATTVLLDSIKVEAYGSTVPLVQVASLSAPEPRLLVVQPWDQTLLPEVEKAIQKSDLGLTPANDGTVIRLPVPQLTEERRKDLVRLVKRVAEEGRVAVRNVRRDSNEELKKREKAKEISEDENRRLAQQVQDLTDEHIKEVDSTLADKEKEIMEI